MVGVKVVGGAKMRRSDRPRPIESAALGLIVPDAESRRAIFSPSRVSLLARSTQGKTCLSNIESITIHQNLSCFIGDLGGAYLQFTVI